MSGGFHVDPDDLTTHASSVDSVAESLGEVASAAQTEGFGGLVYGVLFDPLVLAGLGAWSDHIHDNIAKNQQLGHSIADALRANAEVYGGTETSTTTTIRRSGGPA